MWMSLRLPGVRLAAPARLVEAADRQQSSAAGRRLACSVAQLLLDADDADAGDARGHAGEELRHQRAAEADRLEVAAAAIGRDDRDAHLGDDLEQPLVDGGAGSSPRLARAVMSNRPRSTRSSDGILRQLGVDRGGADADQHREIMRVDAFGRADVQRAEGAQPLPRSASECTAQVARIIGMPMRSGPWCSSVRTRWPAPSRTASSASLADALTSAWRSAPDARPRPGRCSR